MNDEIVDGPYEHQDNIGNDGDVWTSTIFSDVATFLLTCSPGEDGESLPQQVLTKLSLAVTEVAIFDPNPTIADGRDLQTKCSFWDACIKDYMCCKDGSNGDCSGSFLTDDNVVSIKTMSSNWLILKTSPILMPLSCGSLEVAGALARLV